MLKVLDSAVPVACWACSVSHVSSSLFCPHCSKIQPPPGVDYFSALGLKPCLNLDLAALEQDFHRLSRKLHPDRFARAPENEREWSLADTALLNDAYRTLKDPLRRTEYLLKLVGATTGDESVEHNNPSRVPADLLEEVFDLNMQLEEMRAARKAGAVEPGLEAQLQDAKKKFTAMLGEVDSSLHTQWNAWDKGDEPARQTAQKQMVALLDRRRYLNNLVRDVTEALGA
jgi:molecular chaperone HscB